MYAARHDIKQFSLTSLYKGVEKFEKHLVFPWNEKKTNKYIDLHIIYS